MIICICFEFNPLQNNPDFLTPLKKKAFENIVGNRENAGNQHFLLFPQCFQLFPIQISISESIILSPANASTLV